MNQLQTFSNAEFGSVRTILLEGEPWLVGKDVAAALGYSKPRNAISAHVDDEDKKEAPIQGPLGGTQSMTIINESGLYALIFGSKLPSAKAFKRWVTSEVLPTIRKTGMYIPGQHVEDGPLDVDKVYLVCKAVSDAIGSGRYFISPKGKRLAAGTEDRFLGNYKGDEMSLISSKVYSLYGDLVGDTRPAKALGHELRPLLRKKVADPVMGCVHAAGRTYNAIRFDRRAMEEILAQGQSDRRLESEDVVIARHFLSALREAVASGEYYIQTEDGRDGAGQLLGFMDGEDILLLPTIAYQIYDNSAPGKVVGRSIRPALNRTIADAKREDICRYGVRYRTMRIHLPKCEALCEMPTAAQERFSVKGRHIPLREVEGHTAQSNAPRPGINLRWNEELGVYIALVPELPGCIAGGLTEEEALKNVKLLIAG